jgi:GNAT superfamily N-acetyltransferase
MMSEGERQRAVAAVVAKLLLPPSIAVRAWDEADFPVVQRLSAAEGWTTPTERPGAALAAWQHSWPALVAVHERAVIGFSRALSDGSVTTYIAEVLVAADWRGRGVATALLRTSHRLCPGTRLDLLATSASRPFYESLGLRPCAAFRWSWLEEVASSQEQHE